MGNERPGVSEVCSERLVSPRTTSTLWASEAGARISWSATPTSGLLGACNLNSTRAVGQSGELEPAGGVGDRIAQEGAGAAEEVQALRGERRLVRLVAAVAVELSEG